MEAAIARYVAGKLGVAEVEVSGLSRIYGGASRETWVFDAAWRDEAPHSQRFVLRKDPPASLLETNREVEYAFYSAFWGTDVPVPRMRWFEPDPGIVGSPFFIMEFIPDCDGGTRRILEPDYDDCRPAIAQHKYEILAALHAFDWRDTPIERVADVPAPDECWRRELDHWERIIDENELAPQPIVRAGIRWLRANPPPPARAITVVHGDYRTGNYLYRKDGRIYGIVDWEMAHLGDPLEDIAWSFMEAWQWAGNHLKGGIVEAETALATYEQASGCRVDRDALHWWEVFSGVKGQGIWLTGAKSFQEGRSNELVLAVTAYWLINYQDEILLRALGRGA